MKLGFSIPILLVAGSASAFPLPNLLGSAQLRNNKRAVVTVYADPVYLTVYGSPAVVTEFATASPTEIPVYDVVTVVETVQVTAAAAPENTSPAEQGQSSTSSQSAVTTFQSTVAKLSTIFHSSSTADDTSVTFTTQARQISEPSAAPTSQSSEAQLSTFSTSTSSAVSTTSTSISSSIQTSQPENSSSLSSSAAVTSSAQATLTSTPVQTTQLSSTSAAPTTTSTEAPQGTPANDDTQVTTNAQDVVVKTAVNYVTVIETQYADGQTPQAQSTQATEEAVSTSSSAVTTSSSPATTSSSAATSTQTQTTEVNPTTESVQTSSSPSGVETTQQALTPSTSTRAPTIDTAQQEQTTTQAQTTEQVVQTTTQPEPAPTTSSLSSSSTSTSASTTQALAPSTEQQETTSAAPKTTQDQQRNVKTPTPLAVTTLRTLTTSSSSTSTSTSAAATSTSPVNAMGGVPETITYSPYNADSTCKDAATVLSDLTQVAGKGIKAVRIYGTDCNSINTVETAAKQLGLQIDQGFWIGPTGADSIDEGVQSLIDWVQQSNNNDWSIFQTFTIGNEAVYGGFIDGATLLAKIKSVKAQLRAAGWTGTVTTAEPPQTYLNYPDLCTDTSGVDYIGVNAHPYFDPSTSAATSGQFVLAQISTVQSACNNRQVQITETGYPSSGNVNGLNVPSPANQAVAIKSILEALNYKGVLFTCFNDLWKAPGPYNVEQAFGALNLF